MNETYRLVADDAGNPVVEVVRVERQSVGQAKTALMLLQREIVDREGQLDVCRLRFVALGELVDQAAKQHKET